MTACVNKKHSRRVAAAVSASLVGALTLGAAPAVVMAQEAPVDQQFAEPSGAFSDAKVEEAVVRQNGTFTPDSDGVIRVPFLENKPVSFEYFKVSMFGLSSQSDDFQIDPAADDDLFEVAFYSRDSKGNPDGDEITQDLTAPGQYCAVITGVEGSQYEEGKLVIPIDIVARSVDVKIIGASTLYYDATVHNDDFEFSFNGTPVTEGVDYDVYYIVDSHDTNEKADVKNAGEYRAVIMGKGAYERTFELSPVITVKARDLGDHTNVHLEGLAATGSDEIENILAIWINGHRFTGDDAIMSELKADIDVKDVDGDSITATSPDYAGTVWKDNGKYRYSLTKKDAANANIKSVYRGFDAFKVKYLANFQYDGDAWPTAWETVVADADTIWNSKYVTAHADNDRKGGVDLSYSAGEIEKYRVFDEDGNDVTASTSWSTTPGTYTLVYRVTPAELDACDYVYGGQAVTKLTVYKEAVNADAKAAVLFDVDGDGDLDVVSSINVVYNPSVNLKTKINVVVEDKAGNDLVASGDAVVTYYDSEGREVKGALTDAGTYTLKVTSHDYKLTGTTEMTITIAPKSLGTVKPAIQKPLKFDDTSNHGYYVAWEPDGVTLKHLQLQYLPEGEKDVPSNWVNVPMDAYKVTITNEAGEEVSKMEYEGVYTLHFELRNADAQNNYGAIADMTVTVIKDGSYGTVDHTLFSDVTYRDYFADPVAWVNNKRFMTGYDKTRVFGAYDSLSRGQVACVLYNMAVAHNKVDDSSLKYNELFGYDTGFSDVNGKAYYAKAIAWAAQAGVVNGYADGTFHADQPVTRQEFACMLANYAKAYGTYEAAGSDALDEMSDAEQVADFAKDSVACVSVNLSFADFTNEPHPFAPTHMRRSRQRHAPLPASRSGARSLVR